MNLYDLARPALFALDPETAHGLAIRALKLGLATPILSKADPRLRVSAMGLTFPNPLGMAAGFDKNGEVPDALLSLGFGFTEIGTVTPKPQSGNPRPRIFRLVADRSMINRLGFNNEGHAALRARLAARAERGGIVGVNLGANKDTVDRAADYVAGIEAFAPLACYFTINVSSPNTPGLRELQMRAALSDLLARVLAARDAAAGRHGRVVPILLKISPDMDDAGLEAVAAEARARAIDGVIVANTTTARRGLRDPKAVETGGLSGAPLFRASTIAVAKMRRLLGKNMIIIGVGGVESGETAFAKILAGANLVQLYTGLVYQGPGLVGDIVAHFSRELDRRGTGSIADLVGSEMQAWIAGVPGAG